MDNLERTGCATLLSFVSFAIFLTGAVAIVLLFVNDEGGDPSDGGGSLAGLAPVIFTFIGSFIALTISTALTIIASFFRVRAIWMLALQLPAFGFFAWVWLQM